MNGDHANVLWADDGSEEFSFPDWSFPNGQTVHLSYVRASMHSMVCSVQSTEPLPPNLVTFRTYGRSSFPLSAGQRLNNEKNSLPCTVSPKCQTASFFRHQLAPPNPLFFNDGVAFKRRAE